MKRLPKFVKAYGNVNEGIATALSSYVHEVKDGSFPDEKHSFTMKEEEVAALYGGK